MSISNMLNIGRTGMTAHSFATGVTAQNASNATTEGYTRRIAGMEPVPLPSGGGVRAKGARRVIDPFLERRMLGAGSESGYGEGKTQALGVLDAVFADGPGDIGETLGAFEASLAELAAYPDEAGARVAVLSSADALAKAFNRGASEIAVARADTNDRIVDAASEINAKAETIAQLGKEITKAELGGREASDLRDLRDIALRDLSALAPIRTVEADNGGLNVFLAGSVALVDEDHNAHALTTVTDPGSGDVRIHRTTAGLDRDVTDLFSTGRIGGLVDARDGALATARDDLDQLAADIADAYDAAHTAGTGLDGVAGRPLFSARGGVAGSAAALSVDAALVGEPDRIAAGLTGSAGDSRNAEALMNVASTRITRGGGATAAEGYSAMVAEAGSALRAAYRAADSADAGLDQVSALRESISGVSTDEEMVSLMALQRGYQATLKVIQTADEMLADLVNLKR